MYEPHSSLNLRDMLHSKVEYSFSALVIPSISSSEPILK